MLKKLSSFILVAIMACTVYADVQTYSYKKHKPRMKKVVNEFELKVEPLSDGKIKYNRILKGKRYTQEEEFILDENYETISWSTKREKEDTDYSGVKEGNIITLKGKLEGEDISKTIELDDQPFYFTPKFNLTKFILSDQQHIEFWMLRKDKLTKYLMEATKKGETTIEVDGQEVEAIKIRYAATGKGAKYYKRTYFYRKSDGMFIKRKALDGAITELLSTP